MTQPAFRLVDAVGNERLLARMAQGFDFNHWNDDEVLYFGDDKDAYVSWDGDSLEVTSAATNFSAAVTLTTGDMTVTAGDAHVVAQNLYMGAETAFATTEPTSAVVFKSGTAFAGAIGTSSAIQSNGTLLRKIIADGTISNVG
jgi:hypothetical protein